MEEWEYCLLWASPWKTVVVKPGGQVETYSNLSQSGSSGGILVGLQADGWQTIGYNTTPTVDMTYLFKRRVQSRRMDVAPEHPSMFMPVIPPPRPAASPPQ